MKLALSVRIAEAPCKTKLNSPPEELLQLARRHGYEALCVRASLVGVQSTTEEIAAAAHAIHRAEMPVSMVTADFDVPLNNDDGPNSLREIGPSLNVAAALRCDLIRVCLKTADDIPYARRAADEAAERGIRLAHQCHTTTLFENVDESLDVIRQIDRANFGVIYEPANLMLCGDSYGLQTLRRLQPHLMNVYVQNHRLDARGPESLPTWSMGERRFHHIPIWQAGGVRFPLVVESLRRIGYRGSFTIHQAYAHLMGPAEAAERSAEYIRSLLAESSSQ
ncbi:MAG: TIM barrel protein [Pirellulaceae bacterium]|jgi:sugar phosphate isomerase/epimerase|nr:TIM barrel protein [Pirellulaceae bacterium]MDP7017025.1 TIM barrel protein [Pirellulaceae bacterium]